MSVNTGQRKLNARDCRPVAVIQQDLPARWRCLTGEPGFESREVETCELYVELGKPCRIGESTGGDLRFNGLRHLEVQPVKPFQAIPVDTGGVDAVETLENVRNSLRIGLNGGEERSVVGKHGLL